MTDPTKQFHVADLVTITDGRLLSPRHMAAVYDVIDFVTGQPHMTHQLPRAMGTVRPELLRQHPWLADVEIPDGLSRMADVKAWAAWAAETYGEMHEVEQMPDGAYVGRDPIAELREMAPDTPVIGVDTETLQTFDPNPLGES